MTTLNLAPGELDWIEKAGTENLKERLACADMLSKEASTTMTVLLAGMGGSLAYALKLLDGDRSHAVVGAGGACVWLALLAILLVLRCLTIKPIDSLYNEPGNLLKREESALSYEEWRTGEVRNIQVRIDRVRTRNDGFAVSLNRIRMAAALTPLVAVLSVPLFHALANAIARGAPIS